MTMQDRLEVWRIARLAVAEMFPTYVWPDGEASPVQLRASGAPVCPARRDITIAGKVADCRCVRPDGHCGPHAYDYADRSPERSPELMVRC